MKDPLMYHRNALEAMGMLGSRKTIYNILNKVAAHSGDVVLIELVRGVLKDFQHTSTNSEGCPLAEMSGCKGSGGRLLAHISTRLAGLRDS